MEQKHTIALVTGGSRGLGKDMALRLAEKGIDVILTYHSQADAAQAVVEKIEQLGRKVAALRLDTGEIGSFDPFIGELKDTLTQRFGAERLDYLINNAGIGGYQPIPEVTEAFFDQLLNIHFKGVFFLTQKILPLLNEGGGIVNISSGLTRSSASRKTR